VPLIQSSGCMKRAELRKQLRTARRALTPEARRLASVAAALNLCNSPAYRGAQSISVYLPMDRELDPAPFVMRARSDGREVFLPVLPPMEGPLSFRLYLPDSALANNRFGIPEPVSAEGGRVAKDMDLIVTPLVGFDAAGNRLGMGAGFYDRTFGFLKRMERPRPLLIGYAYECQKVEGLGAESWDVPLAGVATEQQFYAFIRI
jgi:5-formyltetrahydrofolate cyclo-ligase